MPVREPKSLYWTTILIIAANFIHYFAIMVAEIFACKPISKAWDPLITEGHCINLLAVNSVSSSINVVSDIVILILPQLVIWRLNMSWKDKAGVSIVFLIALFACASAAIRLAYSIIIWIQYQSDALYYSWLGGIWTFPEITSGIVVSCLPVARGFVKSLPETGILSSVVSSITKIASLLKLSGYRRDSRYELGDLENDPATSPNQRRLWFTAYGVAGLTSLPESDSVRGIRLTDPDMFTERTLDGDSSNIRFRTDTCDSTDSRGSF
ncbi:hypothetical protein F4821DRAFT_94317 [Hypoxylon rubiginosum]|uniref:Uncharacterized protein n=1 Tax=Hypoxylon rubiginosum TaxID=110542 RepID=A0ACC0D6I9_9PEZI|nr:hypothetical protein F4821DRAFT_94317 [Hypoxylon rubiginosum]